MTPGFKAHPMPYADLHVHTVNSDGTLRFQEIPAAAKRANLEAVAITDHDRIHPDFETPMIECNGVTLIHGIELRVDSPAGRIDLLGYMLESTPALEAEVARLQANRIERGSAIIERIESTLDLELDVEPHEGIGRPHIARAVAAHPESSYDVQGVFDDLIGVDGPCYVARDVPTFERGRSLLADSCAIVGLAHPLRYADVDIALELAMSLDAIERWYPYEDGVDTTRLDAIIKSASLLPTGGSDAHGDCLGEVGMGQSAFETLIAHWSDST